MAQRPRPLSGLDAGFLYLEAAGTPMHVGSIMLLERPKRRGYDLHDALVAHLAERLPHAPALRRVLQPAPLALGHPLWIDAPSLDLEWHVLRIRLPRPGTPAQLWNLVAELHAEMLPRDRPLWQFAAIDGLADGRLAMYSKIHHAVLDGQGGVALARALLDLEARPAPRPSAGAGGTREAPRRRDVARATAGATVRQLTSLLRAIPPTIRAAAEAGRGARSLAATLRDSVLLAPRTPFNVQVGAGRRFAAASLPLERAKQVARAFGVSLNDVVMALCADALRAHLARRRALPEAALVAAMPVSLRTAGDGEANNQVSMVQCSLATDIADPVARLRAIAASTAGIKQRVSTFRSLIPTDFPGFAAPLWASGLSRLWARGRIAERLPPLANLVISNVPGPPVPLFLAGARLAHYYPVSIVTHGLGVNITVQSYSGSLEFGILAAREALPSPQSLADGLSRALQTLEARTET